MWLATWDVMVDLAPWLLLGAAAAGLLHVLVPGDLIQRHLTGRWGVVKAVLFGVPLPLCSCGVIPAGIGLKRDGASDGASVAFLVATPQTGVDSILVSAGMLGWPFALFKVGAAAVTGVVAGWLTDRVSDGTQVVEASASAPSTGPWWRRALIHADDVLASIWGWLAVGVLVSAALTVWVPPNALAETPWASGLLAGVAVLFLSLPLYVCATASVPVAAGLLHAGLPPSAALVFLMAGPASNVATLGAVYRTFGGRVLGVYLSTVAVGSLGLGWLFDAVLPAAGSHGAHLHGGVWDDLAAVVLTALLVRYAWLDLRARWAPAIDAGSEGEVQELEVGGMTCQGCVRKLDSAVRGVPGVQAAEVSLEGGRVTVQGAVRLQALHSAIEEAGFEVRS